MEKIIFQYLYNPDFTRVPMVIAFTSQEEAKKACDLGVLYRAQLFSCEPYWAPLRPTQCFKCWKWGHIARYCRKDPLCPRCGAGTHGPGGKEGEEQCPTYTTG